MTKSETGARIAALLEKKGMTQRKLAAIVGSSESAMSKYIKGEREPRAEVLANIATALNTTSEYLLGKEDGIATPFGKVKAICARAAEDFSDEQRNELIMAILTAPKRG